MWNRERLNAMLKEYVGQWYLGKISRPPILRPVFNSLDW